MTSDPGTWTADDLPVIGEPVVVELANTLYGRGSGRIDFLATPELIRLWFPRVPDAPPLPGRLDDDDVGSLRALRDAVHTLVGAMVDRTHLPVGAVAVLNRAAGRAPRTAALQLTGGVVRIRSTTEARGMDAVLGAIAHDAITLLAGPDAERLRRCDHPECTMAFVQRHRRRRWCHPSCGHRIRQATYYRRKVALADRGLRPSSGR